MAKPWPIPNLDATEPLTPCLRKILDARIREMYSFEKATAETDDVDALHDMRVSGRRLQTLFMVFRPLFPKKAFKREIRELRGLLKALGGVREQDVLLHILRKTLSAMPDEGRRPLALLVAREELTRKRARSALRQRLQRLRRNRFDNRLRTLTPRQR